MLEPWYYEMKRARPGHREPLRRRQGLGYIPDAENAYCAAGTGSALAPLSWQAGAAPAGSGDDGPTSDVVQCCGIVVLVVRQFLAGCGRFVVSTTGVT